jgi:hypothetical protein
MRRYTQKEMSEILRLAAEGQKNEAPVAGEYSLEEIQRVAGEVGLDPSRIELAALQLENRAGRGSRQDPWQDSVIIPLAAPPTDEDWENTVAKLREVIGTVGTIRETANGSLEWSGSKETNTYVAVLHRGPNPRLTLSVNRSGTQTVTWALGLPLGFITALISTAVLAKGGLSPNEALILAGAVGLTTGGGIYGMLKATSAFGRARTNRLRQDLQHLLHRESAAPAANPASSVIDEPEHLEVQS